MVKVRVFEAFSGIGSQNKSLGNTGVDYEVVATSEVDEYAVLSYDAIHTKFRGDCTVEEDEMSSYLERLNIPLDSKGKRKVLKGKKLRDFYNAVIRSKNIGDISKVKAEELPDFDLFTYSFPCQDISIAGSKKGFDEYSGTRSSLLWECRRIIKAKKPKYLLLENVKNLIGVSNKDNFLKWLEWLEDLGYTNSWKVLNARDYGLAQNRERVYVVSVLGEEEFEFREEHHDPKVLEDFLDDEDTVDEKYYLSSKIQDRFLYRPRKTSISILGTSNQFKKIGQRDIVYGTDGIMSALLASDYKQPKQILRLGNKSIEHFGKDKTLRLRKLTPLEYWRLMGFSEEDFHKAESVVSDTQMYKQAGNSIAVNVLESIFKEMFK